MTSWIISASIHLDKIWGEFELDVLIWFEQLVLLCIRAPTHVKVRCSGSQKSVSDLHTYVTMSHQRGPLCVMLFSQFPLILCSCHPNLMTMFYLPSCQLSLLLYSCYEKNSLQTHNKGIIICLNLWGLHLYAWLNNVFCYWGLSLRWMVGFEVRLG